MIIRLLRMTDRIEVMALIAAYVLRITVVEEHVAIIGSALVMDYCYGRNCRRPV
jgi:hypothetical protein